MTNSQRLATVRAHLYRWLSNQVSSSTAELADDAHQAAIVSESILIRDGFYAGRTFSATANGDSFRATWFMEPDELKIHGAGGELAASFQGDQIHAEDAVADDAVSDEDVAATEQGPVSIPMPAIPMPAADQSESKKRDDDEDRVSKAA